MKVLGLFLAATDAGPVQCPVTAPSPGRPPPPLPAGAVSGHGVQSPPPPPARPGHCTVDGTHAPRSRRTRCSAAVPGQTDAGPHQTARELAASPAAVAKQDVRSGGPATLQTCSSITSQGESVGKSLRSFSGGHFDGPPGTRSPPPVRCRLNNEVTVNRRKGIRPL